MALMPRAMRRVVVWSEVKEEERATARPGGHERNTATRCSARARSFGRRLLRKSLEARNGPLAAFSSPRRGRARVRYVALLMGGKEWGRTHRHADARLAALKTGRSPGMRFFSIAKRHGADAAIGRREQRRSRSKAT